MLRMDGDGTRSRRTPRLVGSESDTLNVPIMLADARGRPRGNFECGEVDGGRGRVDYRNMDFLILLLLSLLVMLYYLHG